MSEDLILSLVGIFTSLIYANLPGVKRWFEQLPSDYKPLVNLATIFVVAVGVLVYNCRGDGACYAANYEAAIRSFIFAVISNQTTYMVGVRQQKKAA